MNLIDRLRDEVYKLINRYGFTDVRTVKKSQELDEIIAVVQIQLNKQKSKRLDF